MRLNSLCGQSGVPLVIDAWALDLIPELADTINPETTVLTPHHGEASRLLTRLGTPTSWGPRWPRPPCATRISSTYVVKGPCHRVADPA